MNRFRIILVLVILTGCTNNQPVPSDRHEKVADISDLEMSDYTRGIYAGRRDRLRAEISNGIVVLRSAYGYKGGRHEFRAANNFYYLTGLAQPGYVAVITDDDLARFTLLADERSIREIIYSGSLPSPQSLAGDYGADTVMATGMLDQIVAKAVSSGKTVYTDFNDTSLTDRIRKMTAELTRPKGTTLDISPLIDEMRVIKDDYEISLLRKAADITGEAVINVCRNCRPGMYEFEIEALIEYIFRRSGSSMPGFGSIVASGKNAVTLHYSANNRRMEDGDLLLIDIGAEYGYYTADISRTIPVNGEFTDKQKEIYNIVLEAQRAAIEEMVPGRHIVAAHNRATAVIAQGLHRLGLITDPDCEWQRKFYILYPISHFVGMNVHDVGDYGAPDEVFRQYIANDTLYGRCFEKGMVLTVEPGIYLRSKGLSQLDQLYGQEALPGEIADFIEKVGTIYEAYSNIGVRIEDDVLITDNGNILLSAGIPKEIAEIEKIMRKHK